MLAAREGIERKRQYVPQSAQEEFIVPLLRRAIEAQLIRLLPSTASEGLKVLDAGCGAQPFRHLIEERGGAYFALDVTPQANVELDFVAQLDDPDLDLAAIGRDSYDIILCSEVLEHVAEWDIAFQNLSSLLAPGGTLLVSAPHFYPLHEEPYDFWRPTPYAIAYFAVKHGLLVKEEHRLGSGWHVLGTLLSRQEFSATRRALPLRLISRTCKIAQTVLLRALVRGRLQAAVKDSGPLYLANLQVLKKRALAA
jgi:SAM-dependent methyltransferase